MDRERNRTPLEKLRQVAEDALVEHQLHDRVELVSTECLGPCSQGHVMGYGVPGKDWLMFTGMNDPGAVNSLVENLAREASADRDLSPDLRRRLEAVIPEKNKRKLPVKALIPVEPR